MFRLALTSVAVTCLPLLAPILYASFHLVEAALGTVDLAIAGRNWKLSQLAKVRIARNRKCHDRLKIFRSRTFTLVSLVSWNLRSKTFSKHSLISQYKSSNARTNLSLLSRTEVHLKQNRTLKFDCRIIAPHFMGRKYLCVR
jgi:hypothetical protein